MMMMMMKMMMKMMLFVSFLSHFSLTFPLKDEDGLQSPGLRNRLSCVEPCACEAVALSPQCTGCVCEPGENGTNTTRLIDMLWMIRNKPTPSVNLTCVCLCECQCVVQLDVNSSVIQVKESKREMLGDECMKLVKDLSVMEESGDTSGSFIVTPLVGASLFITLLLLWFTLFKRPETEAGEYDEAGKPTSRD